MFLSGKSSEYFYFDFAWRQNSNEQGKEYMRDVTIINIPSETQSYSCMITFPNSCIVWHFSINFAQ